MYLNILRLVAGAGFSASAGYELQLARMQLRAMANSSGIAFEEIWIRGVGGSEVSTTGVTTSGLPSLL